MGLILTAYTSQLTAYGLLTKLNFDHIAFTLQPGFSIWAALL